MTAAMATQRYWSAEAARDAAPASLFRTVMLDDQAMAAFGGRPIVVLSPHFDDACFSLGAFLARLGKGVLINIFTQGNYLAGRPDGADQQRVYQLRDAEDAAFAARCGLTRHDIGCEEPSLRGRRPSQLECLDDDIGQMRLPVLAKLEKLADGFAAGTRACLFAPLGVGRHVNHRATAELVLRSLAALHVRYDVYLYEDLPYARKFWDRLTALWRARRLAPVRQRYALRCDWAEKKILLGLYPSQLTGRPGRLRYWPRALTPFAPHEAFWSVRPAGSAA